ncbi:MAG: F0F1 ATP synthase subunit B [Candidatus Nealsonbacteria bacterium]|nr:F0F1 ATP synthase subunit B [Candidatus Nealsonbacteria bacterium]
MLEKLGIDWKLLLFQVVNFLLLFFILRKVLYKPILNFLEARRKKIEEGLAKSEKFEEEWQKIKDVQKESLAKTEREAFAIIEKARSFAEKKEKDILALAQQKSDKIAEEAKREILREKEKIMAEVKKETADFIVFTTEKILKRTINDKDEKELIKETLNALK